MELDEVRTRHDEWVKRVLSVWLESLGDVVVDAHIAGVSRRGDVLFTEQREDSERRRTLGALGELARGRVLFEPFRNPVTPAELQTCVLKVVDLDAQMRRKVRRKKQGTTTFVPTALCVITPSMSDEIRKTAELTLVHEDKPGMYRLAELWRAVVIIVEELGESVSTVWLRLLGRGRVQAQAVEELLQMSSQEPLRDATFELLVAWQQSLPTLNFSAVGSEQDMLENWREIYAKWEQKVTSEGRREARLEGRREARREEKAHAIMTVLEARGFEVTRTQRKTLRECSNLTQLEAWFQAAFTTPDVDSLFRVSSSRRRVAAT